VRRLPVFFVLDCSESMVGESLKKMEEGLQSVIRTLRSDPHALESVYVSVIAFAGIAKTIVPLVEVVSFYSPKLPLGSGTNIGAALDALMHEIDKSVVKTTIDKKGDWKPIVYFFTDGRPTDNPSASITRWQKEYQQKTKLIAISLGKNADFSVLKKISENVIVFEEVKDGDFKKFTDWISASVVAQSKSVNDNLEPASLSKLDETILRIVKEPLETVDESCVTIVGRCSKTSNPYILRYDREVKPVSTRDFKMDFSAYVFGGCYLIDESYFEWSDNRPLITSVNTSSLVGGSGCPHCGNISAFAVCRCSKLLCVNGPGEVQCPWCKTEVSFGLGPSSSEGGFDVSRGRG
jgi:uncharacterized protein YegL